MRRRRDSTKRVSTKPGAVHDSREVTHLGGDFTWGDCHEVRRAFGALIALRVLPRKGDYGDGVHAQLVWVSDARGWFDEHVLRLFPDAIVILDIFHLLRWFAVLEAKLFGTATKRARLLYVQAAQRSASSSAGGGGRTKHMGP